MIVSVYYDNKDLHWKNKNVTQIDVENGFMYCHYYKYGRMHCEKFCTKTHIIIIKPHLVQGER